jgi:excisionase family DNA binding protein
MGTLLTPRQVAERLAVSPRTVYLWIEQGRLSATHLSERVTRISEDALVAFTGGAAGGESIAAEERAVFGSRGGAAVADRPHAPSSPTQRLRGLLSARRGEILAIAERRRTENLRVFGSVARGDASDTSDIDLLVDLKPHASVYDLSGLCVELENLLGVPVDVVPARSLKPEIRERVLSEAVPL